MTTQTTDRHARFGKDLVCAPIMPYARRTRGIAPRGSFAVSGDRRYSLRSTSAIDDRAADRAGTNAPSTAIPTPARNIQASSGAE